MMRSTIGADRYMIRCQSMLQPETERCRRQRELPILAVCSRPESPGGSRSRLFTLTETPVTVSCQSTLP
jgi:hypothetical protein